MNGGRLWASSKSNHWSTPRDLFYQLDSEFNFTLDPCASEINFKCKKYFTEKDDGLIQDWSDDRVFMNPPYGRQIGNWVRKAYKESLRGALVVCLIPSRTDTSYWHDYIEKKAEVRFIRGRLKFGGGKGTAPFASAIVIFKENKINIESNKKE